MPKRKCDAEVKIKTKLRRIERMLKECKSRRKRVISSSSDSSTQSSHNQNGEETRNHLNGDTDVDSILLPDIRPTNETVPAQVPPIYSNYHETPEPSKSHEVPASLPATSLDSLPTQGVAAPPMSEEGQSKVDDYLMQEKVAEESEINDDILELLGDDPTVTEQYGKDIRPELASRFNHIAVNGLTKDVRRELCEKYLLPANCTMIGAPSLNAEVKVALNENTLKRDKLIEYRQKRMAAAISCLGEALSCALNAKEKDNAQIKRLMDTARLICDAQYNDSVSRRNLAVSSLKKEMKDPLLNTKIDKSLFGENLSDSLKSAKAVTKSATELKNQVKPGPSKNWKNPATGRKQTATGPGHRRNAPAAPTTPAQPRTKPRTTRSHSSRRQSPPPRRFTRKRY